MNGLDAMAQAITRFEGNNLDALNFRNNNPGNLRRSALSSSYDSRGYCVFTNFTAGYLALLKELRFKFTGQTQTGITPESTLYDFFKVYAPLADNNFPLRYAQFVLGIIHPVCELSKGVDSPLREIWTPEKGQAWDFPLNQYLKS